MHLIHIHILEYSLSFTIKLVNDIINFDDFQLISRKLKRFHSCTELVRTPHWTAPEVWKCELHNISDWVILTAAVKYCHVSQPQ